MQELPPHGLHGSHLALQDDIPLQLGQAGAHGLHFVGQHPESDGTWVAQPASNIAPAAIAIKPVFIIIIHFPLYLSLRQITKKFF